jgi:Ca2+-binding RTX toxin-like protein
MRANSGLKLTQRGRQRRPVPALPVTQLALLLGILAVLIGGIMTRGAAAAPAPPCPVPTTTSADGTTVYASSCATEIVVTSPQVRTIYGNENGNVIHSGPNVEAIYGGGGNDVIYANENVELVEGGSGEDVIYGEPPKVETGEETGPAIATVSLRTRRRGHLLSRRQRRGAMATVSQLCTENPCLGGNGGQELHGGEGNDEIFGERGDDTIWGEGGNDALYAGTGDDVVYGGEGNDFTAGGPGTDEIYGNNGNDLVRGDGTIDKIFGGTGTDTLSFSTAVTPGFTGGYPSGITHPTGFPEEESGEARGVYVRLDGASTSCGFPACDNGANLGGGDDEINVGEIENVIGSPFDDIIVGSSGANKIYGGGGADVLIGDGGTDEIFGGAEGDYIEGSSAATAYGGAGSARCVGVGASNECSFTENKVVQHETGTMSAGLMLVKNPAVAHDVAYLVGSSGNDEVNASISGSTVTFSSYGATTFAGESEGCSYTEEGKRASCTLPAEASGLDAVVMAGMKGNDHLAVSGGGFELTTSPELMGGEGNDTLSGSGSTEDVLIDGNGTGEDHLSAFGYDDWLLNNEGKDVLEGGNGNDLLLSSTTCDEDTLNGAEEGSNGDEGAKNNASWAKMASVGVTADLETNSSGSYWDEGTHKPACSVGHTDSLYGIDDLEGSSQSDALFGNGNVNVILGHGGQDSLYGEAGEDTVLAQGDNEKDKVGGGAEKDECRIDLGVDEYSGCETVKPEPVTTTGTPTATAKNGQPGSVVVTGHVSANASLNGLSTNVNLSKKEHGEWVLKVSKHPTLNSSGNYETSEVTGIGEWRVKTVFPEQNGFNGSESEYTTFTISSTGFPTETFETIKSVVNGQPGHVSVEGHVNVTSAEGGPINGLLVNVNFEKEEGGKWVYKNTAQPTIVNSFYEQNNWSVGVGNWRTRAVFQAQSGYLGSESAYHNFTILK